jgi:hypothetical protein
LAAGLKQFWFTHCKIRCHCSRSRVVLCQFARTRKTKRNAGILSDLPF